MADLKIEDSLIVVLSDFHSGGSTALFPNKFWQFKNTNHTPTAKELEMWNHFNKCAEYVRDARKNKRLIVVHDGDAIDGNHYAIQNLTVDLDEQTAIHSELMDHFLRKAKFTKGDKLYYVTGTEVHTEAKEYKVAEDMEADGIFDYLELEVNGRLLHFVHHGKKRGAGANEGNGVRNWLRDIHYDCEKAGVRTPDMMITGHTHTPTWQAYIYRKGHDYRMLHGVIAPSWQRKTRFALKVAPVDINQIGAVFIDIKADGEIRTPKFMLMDTKESETVRV